MNGWVNKMKNFRFRVSLLFIWLVTFLSIKYFLNLFENSTFAYVTVLLISVFIILLPAMIKIPGWLVVLVPTFTFLLGEIWNGGYESMIATTFTLGEAITIVITLSLAYWINSSLHEISELNLNGTISAKKNISTQETNGLAYIYRELRRSRNHNNPLALLAIEIDEREGVQISSNIKKIPGTSKNKEKNLIGIGNILINQLEDISIIVQGDDHFLVALPETKPEDIPFITDRIKKNVKQQLNLNLLIGSATYPKDGYTFEGLIDKATCEMTGILTSTLFGEAKRKASKHPLAAGK